MCKIKGAASEDNEFLKMMETEARRNQTGSRNHAGEQAQSSEESLDYAEDEVFTAVSGRFKSGGYLSDTSLTFLLMNIVEDNDKNSLELLSQSFLGKLPKMDYPIAGAKVITRSWCRKVIWQCCPISASKTVEPENNYEWKDKIKRNTQDLLEVLHGIEKRSQWNWLKERLEMMIDEQKDQSGCGQSARKGQSCQRLGKTFRNELERKPTIQEVADKMGISQNR